MYHVYWCVINSALTCTCDTRLRLCVPICFNQASSENVSFYLLLVEGQFQFYLLVEKTNAVLDSIKRSVTLTNILLWLVDLVRFRSEHSTKMFLVVKFVQEKLQCVQTQNMSGHVAERGCKYRTPEAGSEKKIILTTTLKFCQSQKHKVNSRIQLFN